MSPKTARRVTTQASHSQKSARSAKTSSQNLPPAPSLWQTLGPSFILLGLALGSGELILWPYLTANYGLGLLWGVVVGITFQYVLNTEVMRYTLIWGESVFVGFRRLSAWLPLWFIVSTLVPWSLPGFSSASTEILSMFIPVDSRLITIVFLLLTGILLSMGKTLYKTMERLQKYNVAIGLPFVLLLTILLTNQVDWQEAVQGIVGRGDGWSFFPPGIAIASFLGAFAYAGAGGNLNLSQSYYVKEKGFGMGKYAAKISSLLSGAGEGMTLEGKPFADTPHNRQLWKQWWRVVTTEHLLVFWLLGFLTITVLAVLAKALVYGQGVDQGISFLIAESQVITQRLHPYVGTFFLLIAAQMLFFTQTGILESSSRMISENLILLFHKPGQKVKLSLAFYVALWAQILFGIGIYLFGWQEPRFLLTLAAVLNAMAMMVAFPLVYLLNRRFIKPQFQPGLVRKAILLIAFLFFVVFVGLTLQKSL